MVTTKSRTPKSGTPKSTAKPRATKVRAAAAKPRTAALRKGTTAATKAGSSRAVVTETADMVIAGAGPVTTAAQATSADLPQTTDAAEDASYKKKHLIERVVAISGAKKRVAKDVVEATLAALGDALVEGRTINLPPLGKLTVNRQKDLASGEVLIVKLRRGGAAGKPGADPLADSGEAG